jgi:hypothetical protein
LDVSEQTISQSRLGYVMPQETTPNLAVGKSLWLYEEETLSLLSQAQEQAVELQKEREQEKNKIYPVVRTYDEDYYNEDDLDASDASEGESSSSSGSSISLDEKSSSESNEEETNGKKSSDTQGGKTNANTKIPKKPRSKKDNASKKTRRMQQEIHQHCSNLITTAIPVTPSAVEEEMNEESPSYHLQLPSALLSKHEQQYGTPVSKANGYLQLSSGLQAQSKNKNYVVILLLQSGRFAGAMFAQDKCIQHKAFQHYTVRKGQGKAQSAQDSQRRAKSMGSQLRRQGEIKLKEDVQNLLSQEWASLIQNASLILVSCPKTMMSTMFSTDATDGLLSRNDARVRKVPITVGRPTFESAQVVHQVMMKVFLKETTHESVPTMVVGDDDKAGTATNDPKKSSNQEEEAQPAEPQMIELTKLHGICQAGNHAELVEWLSSTDASDTIDQPAGADFMTPLHYAASAAKPSCDESPDNSDEAACVYDLLVSGRANPTILDARLRPAYFVAANDKVREAFRKARAMLGEDYCDWNASKVGPPLSESDIQQKKAKEAEKRRRKKAKAKERKAKEIQAEEAAAKEQASQEAEKEAHAKGGVKTCDFCQTPVRGKKNSFKRLEFVYCSTDCVIKHKRELMASAALARFGG